MPPAHSRADRLPDWKHIGDFIYGPENESEFFGQLQSCNDYVLDTLIADGLSQVTRKLAGRLSESRLVQSLAERRIPELTEADGVQAQ